MNRYIKCLKVLCSGVRITKDAYSDACYATTISSRVMKITAGYWPRKKLKFVATRRPQGVSEEDFIKMEYKDYQNIDSKYSAVSKIYKNFKNLNKN